MDAQAYIAKAQTYYQKVGEANFRKLIDDFYDHLSDDPLLRSMYPKDLEPAKERLFLFIIQYFGGPQRYAEKRGHPRLRARHARFPVTEEARQHWMQHMTHALDQNPMDEEAKTFLKGYFEYTARFLKNR
jgi:hemoglobin